MKKLLSGARLSVAGVLLFVIIFLLFIGGAKIAVWAEPWVRLIAGLGLVIVTPISSLLLIPRKTRGWGGMGIYLASWPVWLSVWLSSVIYAIEKSLFWAIVGVLFGGIGVIPVAGIMTILRGDWGNLVGLVFSVAIALALSSVGERIMTKVAERQERELWYGVELP